MKLLYLFCSILVTCSTHCMSIMKPFNGDIEKAREYIRIARSQNLDDWKDCPISEAISTQHIPILKILVEEGKYPINAIKKAYAHALHMAPLHWAICDRKLTSLRYLLSHGANINLKTVCDFKAAEQTPLHLAVEYSSNDNMILMTLLCNNAKTSEQNGKGLTAYEYALEKNKKETARIIKAWEDSKID